MRQWLVGLPLLLLALAVAWPQAGAPWLAPAVPAPPDRGTAGIQPLTPAELADAAATIDRLVDARLAALGVKPTPPTTDEQFLRRAYLTIIGRIPTVDEAQAFLASGAPGGRDALIERLVGSEGRVLHEYAFLADLLRVQTRLADRYPGQNYIAWLKEALRDNLPYDALVRELVTAEGAALARGNGATGFYLRDAGMPLDHMATVAQVFLGTQIGCAQCHDHPFDTWTRKQFYEFAAYTHGSDAQRQLPALKDLRKKVGGKEQPPEVKKAVQLLTTTVGLRVKGTRTSQLALPRDYQYDDAAPGTLVAAATMLGAPAPVEARRDPRPVFAAWLTSPENPRFSVVIANRLWKRAFGRGLIEPVDDLKDDTVASDPALMEHLARLMVSVGYDLRRFQRILYSTAAWQRQAERREAGPDEAFAFAGPLVRRLSAEQAWDSLLTLQVGDPDGRTGEDASRLVAFYEAMKDKTADDLRALIDEMVTARTQAQEIQLRIKALKAEQATATGKPLRALRQRMGGLEEERQALLDRSELARMGAMVDRKKPKGNGKGAAGQLLRAAELPSPAPQGHFLRTFGQSDREVIDNASDGAAVTQALTLLNGPIDARLFAADSVLSRTIARAADDRGRVRATYLAILSRQPTGDELALGATYLARYPDGGVQDLAWALLNGGEFLFLQ
jgi:hypothetical protein